jgi:spore coat protein U-like protein
VKRSFRALVAAALSLVAPHAAAATCTVSAVNLAFGSYSPFQARNTDTTGNIAVTCSGVPGDGVVYAIAISSGFGTLSQRRMRSAAGAWLNYNIYTSAARTLVWGDGSSGSMMVFDSYKLGGPNVTRNYPVYGRTPALHKTPVALYSDSIVVTLNF